MTRGLSLLSSTTPTNNTPAQLHISHVQLRDLIICPRERGVVNYVTRRSIVEHNVNTPGSVPRTLVDLDFSPNTLSSLQLDEKGHTLLAAGGQEAELHLSLHNNNSSTSRRTPSWTFYDRLHASINNSVKLTSLNVTRSHESSVEPRIAISNNDCTVKFFDIPISVRGSTISKIKDVGTVSLNAPVNHSSISPDGQTLLSVGDSSKVFLHRISGGSRLTFSPISTPVVPSPENSPHFYSSPTFVGSFSSAFSPDGTKYAVASQEGVVAVWDVRSTKPLKVFQTDKTRYPSANNNWGVTGTGSATGWLSDDPYEWTRGHSRAPGWCVRNVKFGGTGCGKETMIFTEHTSLLHVVDARTFETEEIIRVPPISSSSSTLSSSQSVTSSRSPSSSTTRRPLRNQVLNSRARYYQRPYQRPTSTGSRHVSVSATSHLSSRRDQSQPPVPPYVILALEDTFRISARGNVTTSSSTAPTSYRDLFSSSSSLRSNPPQEPSHDGTDLAEDVFGAFSMPRSGDDDEDSDLVVIPTLGDPEVEDDVRTLLGRHGLQGRSLDMRDGGMINEEDDRMDVDEMDTERSAPEPEMEWDCISSHAPSRTSSPPPPAASSGNRWRMWPAVEPIVPDDDESESEDEDGIGSGFGTGKGQDSHSTLSTDDQDIAGTCFDPSGAYIYVGTTDSVVEWNVRGAEKTWWLDDGNEWC
ncbi:hypothetical protein D9758_008322 [Tetrapyrgos nigripes]|uniref:DUF2415 domain-containing protein n=1 Tax=Tetrapyrgos nigripes TaxID=182062 RepID=A0A8H5GDZ6_9AGAR|nr:hypothetical protein D9758_008322 [Tetrapyrgos nigripes]